MTKPRFVIDTDEEFKKKIMDKLYLQGKTLKELVTKFLTKWVNK